ARRARRAVSRSSLAAGEDGAEPALGAGTGGEREGEDRGERVEAVQVLDHGAQAGGASAALDGPGDVLAADLQRALLAVVGDQHVEVATAQRDAVGEVELVEELTGVQQVAGAADEPEVAEHAARDDHTIDDAAA